MKVSCLLIFCLLVMSGCNSQEKPNKAPTQEIPGAKPPSSYNDTLTIDYLSAVFYLPDSMQLERIKASTGKQVFEGSMHEYESQFRNSKNVLAADWAQVRVTEVKKIRFLRFIKNNKQVSLVDLNTKGDPYGLIIFNKEKEPQLVDMTNVDNELYYYFSK